MAEANSEAAARRALSPASGQFIIHRVLATAARLFLRRPLAYTLSTAFVQFASGMALGTALTLSGYDPEAMFQYRLWDNPYLSAAQLVVTVFGLVTAGLSSTAPFQIAKQDLQGSRLRLGSLVGGIIVTAAPLTILTVTSTLAITAGLLLLAAPGLILMSMWAVAAPACAFERLGPFASLGRSARLTRGFRWRALGLVLLLWAMNVAETVAEQMIPNLTLSADAFSAGIGIAWMVAKIAYFAFYCLVLAVAFHDLRAAAEGGDTDGIAAVFE